MVYKILYWLSIYFVTGGIAFFIFYYLGKRWPNIFVLPDDNHITAEFFLTVFLWPILAIVDIWTTIKHFIGDVNLNPIRFFCNKIDRIVDKQQGKLNKDVVLKFKIK